ncbi:MAG: hypothetical protein FWD49_01150 [Firmicutes bacterium]|nr:hypothetical protein [Bacillota bacterium]
MITFFETNTLYFVIALFVFGTGLFAYCALREIPLLKRNEVSYHTFKQKAKLFNPPRDILFLILSAIFALYSIFCVVISCLSPVTLIYLLAIAPVILAVGAELFLTLTRGKLKRGILGFKDYFSKIERGALGEVLGEYERIFNKFASEREASRERLKRWDNYLSVKPNSAVADELFNEVFKELDEQKKLILCYGELEILRFNEEFKKHLRGEKAEPFPSEPPKILEENLARLVVGVEEKCDEALNRAVEESIENNGFLNYPKEVFDKLDKRELGRLLSKMLSHSATESLNYIMGFLSVEHIGAINFALNSCAPNSEYRALESFKAILSTELLLGDISVKYENMLLILYHYYKRGGAPDHSILSIYKNQNLEGNFEKIETAYRKAQDENQELFGEFSKNILRFSGAKNICEEALNLIDKGKLLALSAEYKTHLNIKGVQLLNALLSALQDQETYEKHMKNLLEQKEMLPIIYRIERERLAQNSFCAMHNAQRTAHSEGN